MTAEVSSRYRPRPFHHTAHSSRVQDRSPLAMNYETKFSFPLMSKVVDCLAHTFCVQTAQSVDALIGHDGRVTAVKV